MDNKIYILSNPNNSKYSVIGTSSNIEKTIQLINKIEFKPCTFLLYAFYPTSPSITDKTMWKLVEKWFPKAASIEIKDSDRHYKFFELKPKELYNMLSDIAELSDAKEKVKINPKFSEDINTRNDDLVSSKEGNFKFSDCRIEVGEYVTYVADPSIRVKVCDDKHVLYNGETITLTALASLLTRRKIKNGPRLFSYKGERLTTLRIKIRSKA